MPEDFVIARNPELGSKLPFLLRIPLGGGVVLKARETWPRTSKVYCHRAQGWPAQPEVVERVGVRSCVRRGAAIDLVLDRHRENRSQIVFTVLRDGREAIFWQTARTVRQARPRVRQPTARASGVADFTILVDVSERYGYRFKRQRVRTEGRRLAAGDYAVELAGQVVAAVERKSLADLVSSLVSGRMGYALAELATLPRAAVVVEDRYSRLFNLEHVRPAVAADALAEVQVRWPSVPVVFCETRALAEEWIYRYLAAAFVELAASADAAQLEQTLPAAAALGEREPTASEIRAWARAQGIAVSDRGRVPREIQQAYHLALPVTGRAGT